MRINLSKILLLSALAYFVSGCATISKEQCELGDWYQQGLTDGQRGKKNMAADYQKDCAEFKVTVDVTKYNNGRDEGLKSYCSYENGVYIGQLGESYRKVCPADLSTEFLSGYTPHYNVASTENELRNKRDEAAWLKKKIKSDKSSEEAKKEAKSSLKEVNKKIKKLEEKLKKHEYELALHKVNREIRIVKVQISQASGTEKVELQAKLDELEDDKQTIKDLRLTEKGIKAIKDIIDLF